MSLCLTSFDVVLLAIQRRLMDVMAYPEERVLLDADDEGHEAPHPQQAEQYLRVKWGDSGFDQDVFEGAGRVVPIEQVQLNVEVWTRLALDDTNQMGIWLTEQTLGHALARHLVLKALAGFQPADTGGRWLVTEPMIPQGTVKPRRKRSGDGWGSSVVRFLVSYALDLGTDYV